MGILGVETTRNDLLCERTYSFFYLECLKMCICTLLASCAISCYVAIFLSFAQQSSLESCIYDDK